jgi:ferrous-iron efflux pump FieF
MISDASQNQNKYKNLKIAALFCLVDIFLTGGAALFSNSLTIMSDFFKEIADFMSVFFALLTLRVIQSHKANEKFSYGIGKLENLASIGVSILMLMSAAFILYQAFGRFQHPEHPQGTLPGIAIFSISAIFSFIMFLRNQKILKTQKSAIVDSQMRLWLSKAWLDGLMATILILSSLLTQYHWSAYLDPLTSLVGVVFLMHGAWKISNSSVHELLDASLEEASQLLIMKKLVEHIDDYESVIKIRTRRSGVQIYIEVFLGFNPNLKMIEVQDKINHLTSAIKSTFEGSEVVVVPSAEANSFQ